ncbi:MAG TPA: hypothetical protein VHO91_18400, partial [Rhodopila sp.]|nr:hypothetical protein [Rhodopila sp.]
MSAVIDRRVEVKTRARRVLVYLPLTALAVGVASTQFVAWRLHYDPALGPSLAGPVYLPWRVIDWWTSPVASDAPGTFEVLRIALTAAGCGAMLAASKALRKKPGKHLTLHGSSRLAADGEVRAMGLLPCPERPRDRYGVYLGLWERSRKVREYIVL